MFQSLQSFLAYLLALLVVYAILRVFRPAFLRDAERELRRQFGTFGCVFLFCAVSLLAGHVVSKNILRSSPLPQIIPEWFTALGYDPADTDGDGIPDCWERWTRTNRAEADDGLDPDGDGVDNFGEFWNQCDPMMADTDGDGYSDYVEIAGKAVGKTWYDPIVPASYVYEDPDSNTNGVPDRWEGTGYVYGFTDLNHDGFPDGLTFRETGGGNFDIEVTVTTSRSALLSWGEGVGNAIVLPPCDGLVVRLRLSGLTDSDVRLSCGTLGDGSEGLWKARMSIRWPSDCPYETEGNRIRIQADEVIDCDAMTVSYRGEVQTTPTRSSGDDVPTSITSPFRRRWIQITAYGDGGCWEHCPGGEAFVTAAYTNIAPPFAWSINGTPVPNVSGDTLDAATFREYWNGERPIQIDCEWTNSVEHRVILLLAWASIDYLGHCQPGSTNITGVASTSSHSHTNATDHLPEVAPESITQYTEYCPPATNLTVKAGWTHNTAMLKIRGLIRILTGNPEDDETDHCIGLIWSKGGSVSLYDYLADCCKPFADKFTYYVNGSPCEGTLEFGDEPEKYHPTVFHVELRDKEDGGETLDRMWVVVNSLQAKNEFNSWYRRNADTDWVNTLPKPYAKLQISSSWLWGDSAAPVNPLNPDPWDSPSKLSGYLHHDSAWEMRAESATSSHGNQACYDASGDIVLNGIGGGTADYTVGDLENLRGHIRDDVNPYLHALHLDGNPGDTRWNNGISRPCLYQGNYLDKYIERRPIIHPEGE